MLSLCPLLRATSFSPHLTHSHSRSPSTGAAGQIAYSLLFSLAKGDVFGPTQVSPSSNVFASAFRAGEKEGVSLDRERKLAGKVVCLGRRSAGIQVCMVLLDAIPSTTMILHQAFSTVIKWGPSISLLTHFPLVPFPRKIPTGTPFVSIAAGEAAAARHSDHAGVLRWCCDGID
jgi:hypothetical protein